MIQQLHSKVFEIENMTDLKIWLHQNLHTNICIIFINNSKIWKNQDVLQ